MASVLDLVYESSEEIDDRARENDIPGRGSMRKGEKIAAVADEELSEDAVAETLLSKKSELVDVADELGIGSPHSHTKAELQEFILEQELENSTPSPSSPDEAVPASDEDGFDRLPQSGCTTRFESSEARQNAIQQFAQRATNRAIEEQAAFVVVESFRPKDQKEPLKIQRAYMERHPDTVVVFEARAPHLAFPIQSAEKNPVFREEA